MKLIAKQDLTIYGTRYKRGATLDVSQEAAEKLIRSGQARITVHELAQHLAGQRFVTPAGKAGGMQVNRR
jgi:hypothetical protein